MAKTSSVKDGVNPLAYQVGPVVVSYGGDPSKSTVADTTPYINESAKTVRSNTDELHWDYGRGFCTVNAPKAQGATGFWSKVAGVAKLKDVDISCGNDYASILVVAMDDKPLATSSKILVQIGTRQHSTGWQTTPTTIDTGNGTSVPGEQIVSYGKAPWCITKAIATVTIHNGALKKATALDPNGMPSQEVPMQVTAAGTTFTLPPDVLYVVLQ